MQKIKTIIVVYLLLELYILGPLNRVNSDFSHMSAWLHENCVR